jgi:3-methyladenine DNA glycosylase/8-oxoguanine DNA glycosylase
MADWYLVAGRDVAGFRAALPRLLQASPEDFPEGPLRGCVDLMRRDERFRALAREVGPPLLRSYPSTFESLARAIAYQQLSGKAARTIWDRVLDRFPGRRATAEGMLRKRDATLRAAGLSRAKVLAVKDLARHVVRGDLDPRGLRRLPDDVVVERLTRVRGIGTWSAHMHLMFSLGRMDVWPTGDLGVRKGLGVFHGRKDPIHPREAEGLGDAYRPWRSLAAWYMWRLLELPRAPV